MAKTIKRPKRAQKQEHIRNGFQTLWALATNSFFKGFASSTISTGALKNLCVPGMNCYSCPGAQGSCPIGALQAVIGGRSFQFSFYVVGFLFFIGGLIGRLVCGWLCPFGWIQDMLFKIPFIKKIRTFRGDRQLRWLKYILLAVFVLLLPMFLVDVFGQGAPYFCKLICPVGMLEGGIPLVSTTPALQKLVGWLYAWKGLVLAVILLLSLMIDRPFCKYVCPLGAIYSFFNRASVYRLRFDEAACIHCGACARACGMGCDPVRNANDRECIRCGRCVAVCPTKALTSGWVNRKSADPNSPSKKKTAVPAVCAGKYTADGE